MLSKQIVIPKLPRRHLPLKQNIQFLKRPPSTLRQSNPAPNQTHRRNPTKQEPRLAPPIRLIRIQHIRHRDREHNARHSLHGSRDGDGAAAEARGRDLADDDEADGPDGHLVREGPDVHQGGLGPDGAAVGAPEVEEGDDEEEERHEDHAGVVDCAAAELGGVSFLGFKGRGGEGRGRTKDIRGQERQVPTKPRAVLPTPTGRC